MNIHEALRELLLVSEKIEAVTGPIQEHLAGFDDCPECPGQDVADAATVDLENLLGEVRTVAGALHLFCFGTAAAEWDECRQKADCHHKRDADG